MSARPGTSVAVRGLDGGAYVARYELGRPMWPLGDVLAWSIYRPGAVGPVTRGATLASAVDNLAMFHRGETCGACGHVHSSRDAHYCHACGRHWTRGRTLEEIENGA